MSATFPANFTEVYSHDYNSKLVAGYFVTDAAHGAPALIAGAGYAKGAFSVESVDSAEGCYKITINDNSIKDMFAVVGTGAVGITSPGVGELTTAADTHVVQGAYIKVTADTEGVIYVRIVKSDGTIEHVAGMLITFIAMIKTTL